MILFLFRNFFGPIILLFIYVLNDIYIKLFFFIDMNRILIREEQLYSLLCEAATLDDIYVKYYSGIDRVIFNQIVSSDPTWREDKPDKMGKFGKWLLKLWLNRR